MSLVIGGWTDPQGARVGLGALLLGSFDGDDLVFAGKLGTGFDVEMLRDVLAPTDRRQPVVEVVDVDDPWSPAPQPSLDPLGLSSLSPAYGSVRQVGA